MLKFWGKRGLGASSKLLDSPCRRPFLLGEIIREAFALSPRLLAPFHHYDDCINDAHRQFVLLEVDPRSQCDPLVLVIAFRDLSSEWIHRKWGLYDRLWHETLFKTVASMLRRQLLG